MLKLPLQAPARSLPFRFSSLLTHKKNSRQLSRKKSNRKAEEGPPREAIQEMVAAVNVRPIDYQKGDRNNRLRDRRIDNRLNNHRRDLQLGRQISRRSIRRDLDHVPLKDRI